MQEGPKAIAAVQQGFGSGRCTGLTWRSGQRRWAQRPAPWSLLVWWGGVSSLLQGKRGLSELENGIANLLAMAIGAAAEAAEQGFSDNLPHCFLRNGKCVFSLAAAKPRSRRALRKLLKAGVREHGSRRPQQPRGLVVAISEKAVPTWVANLTIRRQDTASTGRLLTKRLS